jgi:hypothetical protein
MRKRKPIAPTPREEIAIAEVQNAAETGLPTCSWEDWYIFNQWQRRLGQPATNTSYWYNELHGDERL